MGDNARYGALRQWRKHQRLTEALTVKRIKEGTKRRLHRSSYVGTIGCQQNQGGRSCLSRQVMEELEACVIGRVKVIYQEDDRAMCCEVDEEGCSRLEQRPMFLLWIGRTQSFEVGNGILVEWTLVFGQIAVKRFDKGLIRQLPFLLVGSTGEGDHPRCGCSMQQFTCQPSLAHTRISGEEEHLTMSTPGSAQQCLERFEFALASNQWSIPLSFRDNLRRRHPGWEDGRRRWSNFAMDDTCIQCSGLGIRWHSKFGSECIDTCLVLAESLMASACQGIELHQLAMNEFVSRVLYQQRRQE